MPQVKISVIVPAYNLENYIKESLDSVCCQTLKEIEIICVNNGSQDSTLKVLQDYAKTEPRMKVLTIDNNRRIGPARDLGVQCSCGEYIYFFDGDDILSPQYLEEMYKKARESNADIVINDNFCPFEDDIEMAYTSKVKKIFADGLYNVTPEYILKRHKNVVVWNKLFKKSLIIDNQITFPVGVLFEDECFYFKIMPYAKTVYQYDTGMYYYRQRSSSAVKQMDTKTSFDTFIVFEEIYNFYKKRDLMPKYTLPYRLLAYRRSLVPDYQAYRNEFLSFIDRMNVDKKELCKDSKLKALLKSGSLKEYKRNRVLYSFIPFI